MPTYDYQCKKCSHVFEVHQSITSEPLKKCPQCKGKVERLIGTGAGILFKGSGFYQTDYRSKSYHESAKKDSASPSSGSKAGESAPADSKAKPVSKDAKSGKGA